jgi:hypothetical protein
MALNIFDHAAPVASASAKSPKAELKDLNRKPVAGFAEYAAAKAIADAAEAICKVYRTDVENFVRPAWTQEALRTNKKPTTVEVIGVNGKGEVIPDAVGQLIPTKRTTTSTLKEEEVQLLEENNIPYDIKEDVVEGFLLNPEYAKDPKFLKKISDAVVKAGLPLDTFQRQISTKSPVVSEATVDAVCKLKDPELVGKLLKVVCKEQFKPKFSDVQKAFDLIKTELGLVHKNPKATLVPKSRKLELVK